MKTMTYLEFVQDYVRIKQNNPSYRFGQHFINLFIKEESDVAIQGLWDKTEDEAIIQIYYIIEKYQWDFNCLVVVREF